MVSFLSILVIMLVMIFIGIPVSTSIGLSGLAAIDIFDLRLPLTTISSLFYNGTNSYALMAIPFFIMAGEIMNEAGITKRVLNIAEALVGHLKGGLTYVNCLAAMMMASISGSGTASCAALGKSLIPEMSQRGYDRDYAASLTCCANIVGPIIPPSTMFVLYSFYTGASIMGMFLGGVIPGIMIGVSLMITGSIICKKKGFKQEPEKFSWKRFADAMKKGIVSLMLPVLLFVSIIVGWTTPTEAGAVVSLMALILGIITREINSFKQIIQIAKNTAKATCIVFTLIAISEVLSNVLIRVHFTDLVSDFLGSVTNTTSAMMIVVCIIIFILGTVLDTTPMITMFAITFTTAVVENGGDMIHFGVVFVLICMLGAITPPAGGLLFVATAVSETTQEKMFPYLLPMMLVIFAVTILIVLLPETVTFLPSLLS
jgi:tripartite ATP-independent transporter DctM subunit